MKIILSEKKSVSEQLMAKGLSIPYGESLKVYYTFKKGKRKKIKKVTITCHRPCSDGCCSSYFSYSRQDVPIW